MKTVDVNILLYSVNEDAPQHSKATQWLDQTLSGPDLIGMTWFALAGFLRISTGSILPQPLGPTEALTLIDEWLSTPNVRQIEPGKRHFQILQRLVLEHDLSGGDMTDAHLAAIAIEHNVTLATFDSDFHRFAELDLEYLGAR